MQDVVSGAAEQTGVGGRVVGYGAGALERGIFRRAKLVGIVSDAMHEAVVAKGAAAHSVRTVPNWPVGKLAPLPNRADSRHMLGFKEGEFVCVHAGNIGAKQGLEVVVEAARLAGSKQPLRFVVIGDGNQREQLERRATGVDAVQFWPLQSEDRFLAALAAADLLLLTQRPSVRDMAFPSKLTTYARAGTPIVASVASTSAVARTLGQYDAALLIEPGRPELLLDGIRGLMRDGTRRRQLADGARDYYVMELDPRVLRRKFLAFADEAAAAR